MEIEVNTPNSIVNVTEPTVIMNNGYNLLRSITLYDNAQYYTTVGRAMDGMLCWLDKVNYSYTDARCHETKQWHLTNEPILMNVVTNYDDIVPTQQAVTNWLNIEHATVKNNVECGLSE